MSTVLGLLDFSKAFNTINHKLLLSKCKYLVFDNMALNVIKYYLAYQRQLVLLVINIPNENLFALASHSALR